MLAALLLIAYALYLSGEIEGKNYQPKNFNEYAYEARGWESPNDRFYLQQIYRDYYRILSALNPSTESAETWYYWRPYKDYVAQQENNKR
jgi:hypothetical protein